MNPEPLSRKLATLGARTMLALDTPEPRAAMSEIAQELVDLALEAWRREQGLHLQLCAEPRGDAA